MLYLIKFDVGQPVDLSHRQLFEIWHSEAVAALEAKKEQWADEMKRLIAHQLADA